jgi:hypothetical protein
LKDFPLKVGACCSIGLDAIFFLFCFCNLQYLYVLIVCNVVFFQFVVDCTHQCKLLVINVESSFLVVADQDFIVQHAFVNKVNEDKWFFTILLFFWVFS